VSRLYAHAHAGAARALAQSPCMRQKRSYRQARSAPAGRDAGLSHLVHLRRAERADRAIAQERLHLALDGAAGQRNMYNRMMWRTCCNAAQRSAACCSAARRVAAQRNVLQRSATCYNSAQRVATQRNVLQRRATCGNAAQRVATQQNGTAAAAAANRLQAEALAVCRGGGGATACAPCALRACGRVGGRAGVCASRAEGYSDYVRRG